MTHFGIRISVCQEFRHIVIYLVIIRANKLYGARFQSLGALGRVAHHKHRFAKAGSLLLYAAAVGKHNAGLFHQIDKRQILKRLNEEHVAKTCQIGAEHLVYGLAHIGIKVHGINKIHIGELHGQILDGTTHRDKAIAKIFTAMARNQHKPFTVNQT